MSTRYQWLLLSSAIWLLFSGIAPAQQIQEYTSYSGKQYAALSGPASPDIPVGTKITLQNWRQYKNYMAVGMQALWSAQFAPFKLGNDFVMEVGPTIPVPEPKVYMENTEKYGEANSHPYGAPELACAILRVHTIYSIGSTPLPRMRGLDPGYELHF